MGFLLLDVRFRSQVTRSEGYIGYIGIHVHEYILLNCYYLNLGIKSPLHFGYFTGMGGAGPEWDTEAE